MNAKTSARCLGWMSLAVGIAELAAPSAIANRLGIKGGPRLVRAFGVREIGTGLFILLRPSSASGIDARVSGDALDLAVLTSALGASNPKRLTAAVATVLVAAVTAWDVGTAAALAKPVAA
ncbi:hypothetical protein [Lichenicoccus roseus]|uniref:DUF4267 domain-containing protein n=1 Tax=Lichenicoccus roseus TaxID=2683649 RepID=A0A5R9J274_9PROT|nr:hypothetical protein [Lichenicoccus roseus]TLU70963.1 hypothetical protein FE263_19080 [Lichenicoccus roseus]